MLWRYYTTSSAKNQWVLLDFLSGKTIFLNMVWELNEKIFILQTRRRFYAFFDRYFCSILRKYTVLQKLFG
jgi:hypothetical protein